MKKYLTKHWGMAAVCSETAAYFYDSKATTIDDLRMEITDILKQCSCKSPDYYAVVVYDPPSGASYSGHVGVVSKDKADPYTPLHGATSAKVWILPPTKDPPPPKK